MSSQYTLQLASITLCNGIDSIDNTQKIMDKFTNEKKLKSKKSDYLASLDELTSLVLTSG